MNNDCSKLLMRNGPEAPVTYGQRKVGGASRMVLQRISSRAEPLPERLVQHCDIGSRGGDAQPEIKDLPYGNQSRHEFGELFRSDFG